MSLSSSIVIILVRINQAKGISSKLKDDARQWRAQTRISINSWDQCHGIVSWYSYCLRTIQAELSVMQEPTDPLHQTCDGMFMKCEAPHYSTLSAAFTHISDCHRDKLVVRFLKVAIKQCL